MRGILLLALIGGCQSPNTTVLVQLHAGPMVTATSLSVSVWDVQGALVVDKIVEGSLPGSLIVSGLPDRNQQLRMAFLDGDTMTPLGSAVVDTSAGKQIEIVVTLQKSVADRDGDGVPDDVDNCPDRKNLEQHDANSDGVGDICESGDSGVITDLIGHDLVIGGCGALFCDDFETDTISGSNVNDAAGSPAWGLYGLDPTHAFGSIDGTQGALGSTRSLRFHLVPDIADGGIVTVYQRYEAGIDLYAGVKNLTQILTGPTYVRFFVKLSVPPSTEYGGTATLGYVFWGADGTNNLELTATDSGIHYNDRFAFTNPNAVEPPIAVNWVSGFVCVEWSHEYSAGNYHSTVSVNGTPAGSFDGGGTPSVFGGFTLGTDVEFRGDTPNLVDFTQWFDEVKISNQPIGCN